jgi:hypothetical protein
VSKPCGRDHRGLTVHQQRPRSRDKNIKRKTNMLPILMHQMHISTTQVSSVMLKSKTLAIRRKVKERSDETKQSAMKLSQSHRKIELCLREIILRFGMNIQNLHFSSQFNPYSYFKASTEVLSNCTVETPRN